MENTQSMTVTGNRSSDMETFILSALKKYFKGNSETFGSLKDTESVLYNAVIRYFTNNSQEA